MSIIPNNKPRISRSQIETILKNKEIDTTQYPLIIIGIRGYYKDTMGKVGENDRNMYDDAIILQTPNVTAAFNGNVDPSKFQKGIATLVPGFYPVYKFDTHNGASMQYPAICQRLGKVKVTRDGSTEIYEGNFGINIHMGGMENTWSEGCQTIVKTQWESFYALAKAEQIRLYGNKWDEQVVPYLLVTENDI